MNQEEAILNNKKERETFESIVELIEEEVKHFPGERFFELLRDYANKRLPEKKQYKEEAAMSDEEAVKFGLTIVPFGKFQGKFVHDTPANYIAILTDPNQFYSKLKAYAKSDVFKKRFQ